MRRLLMTSALVLVAGLMVVSTAPAQDDEVTVQEGAPLTASPTATVAAKTQYDGGGGKKKVVVGGGGGTLPETGGVSSIALLAGALLIGGGVMSLALFRRS
jgi:LPXTG-motif cell wall-anchored protein